MSQKDFGEIINTEHVSSVDGENIEAKRVGLYGWDNISATNQWRRLAVDTTGKLVTSGGGSPGGSDTQVQYNNAGAFGGMTTTYDNVTEVVTFGNDLIIKSDQKLILDG
jgi:hypothetical protein